ncbi:hypothetical protein GCM10011588_36280 [Nocardia jinanensis]|uniref:DUF3558 domain-containing protein n=1 Tax=Nocardia jinanensis TaxID=382504 RepID=A0A917RPR2_9NOCA|nr:hypothetical protein GCM10011588_36280 [Nocardia jinanensis]
MTALLAGVVAATSISCSGAGDTADTPPVAHPCDIPATALTEAEIALQPLMTEPFGTEFSGWDGCIWKSTAGWYDAAVYFGPSSLDEFQQDPRYQDYRVAGPAMAGDRTALEFGDALDPDRKERCYFGVELPQGMALIWSRLPVGPGGGAAVGDICAEGERVAEVLSSYLPE